MLRPGTKAALGSWGFPSLPLGQLHLRNGLDGDEVKLVPTIC